MDEMFRLTKFVPFHPRLCAGLASLTEIHPLFMLPKPAHPRLCTSMQLMDTSWESWQQPVGTAAFAAEKEPKLKLSVETRNCGDVVVVHCQGRIVYRDEAAALSRLVGQVLHHTSKLVLDLSGVSSMDSAGIGELALLQTWAQEKNAALKCAGPTPLVLTLLSLTNLDTVLEVHPSVEAALESLREEQAGTDC
jgi:anti-sigma B factor antagonist